MPQNNRRPYHVWTSRKRVKQLKELNKTHEPRALSMHDEQADERITIDFIAI